MKNKQLNPNMEFSAKQKIDFRLSRIEDQLEAIRFEQPKFRLPKIIHPRELLQVAISVLCFCIAYKVIVW